MARILIVTPARPGARNGNRHTSQRWAGFLRTFGYKVSVANDWNGRRCDLLIALHADRSHPSILDYRRRRPRGALIVVLTGTDLYRDLPGSRKARRSLELADRLIVLQEDAIRILPRSARKKARVVYQSSSTPERHSPPRDRYRAAVVGHLRREKDPFRAALALRHLPGDFEVIHVGKALSPKYAKEAKALMRADPRYRWLGSRSHAQALGWIARSHALVLSSRMEGGANVIAEAARIGTPVLASRVSGNVGMLGRRYAGYYPPGDERALARLLLRAARNASMDATLKRSLRSRRGRFAPAAEKAALGRVVRELLR